MNTTKHEKTIKELFLNECWEYLRDNFHKFSETNKIKIALTLSTKDIPQKVEGDVKVTEMPSIKKVYDGLNTNRIAEFVIGSPDTSEDTQPS
jgi:hypothetical protein